jgi:hypothetical protein
VNYLLLEVLEFKKGDTIIYSKEKMENLRKFVELSLKDIFYEIKPNYSFWDEYFNDDSKLEIKKAVKESWEKESLNPFKESLTTENAIFRFWEQIRLRDSDNNFDDLLEDIKNDN